ncbi:MAG: HupE/UreJ family protein [Pontibacterium sp.]
MPLYLIPEPILAVMYPALIRCLLTVCLLVGATSGLAHQNFESYLYLDLTAEPQLRWEIETRNFETLFQLDDNGNEIISWSEIRHHQAELLNYAKPTIRLIYNGTELNLQFGETEVKRLSDQTYLAIEILGLPQEKPHSLQLKYELFFDIDPQQKGLFKLKQHNQETVYILTPDLRSITVEVGNRPLLETVQRFVREGMQHILSGYDHLAFLLMLVVAGSGQQRRLVTVWQNTRPLIKTVTAFSIAHSVTLALTATHTLMIPPATVELFIAVTVLLAAIANLLGKAAVLSWQVAFIFGLIHGFGFAGALEAMNLSDYNFITLMLSFNLGVELGQLLMVIAIVTIFVLLRRKKIIYTYFLSACSTITLILSFYWIIDRAPAFSSLLVPIRLLSLY